MCLLLPCHAVGRYFMGGRFGQHYACELLQAAQLVKLSVPLVVGHQFPTTVVISVGGFVELIGKLPHQLGVVHFLLHILVPLWLCLL